MILHKNMINDASYSFHSNRFWKIRVLHRLSIVLLFTTGMSAQTYICGGAAARSSVRQVIAKNSVYSLTAAGFDLGTAPEHIDASGCTSSKTFFFSVPLPEGNYTVSMVLGGAASSVTTVRAEARRLMLARIWTSAGHYRSESFTVNIRRPEIAEGSVVNRKPREMGSLNWDNKLTIEFSGQQPSVRSIRIQPAGPTTPTVYLAGDSTVVDQDNEPWAAWGQMLPSFFGRGLAISNHAESGETISSFVGEKRFDKIFSMLKKGDYLFFQFAHNDQKLGSGYVSPQSYAGLLRKYIAMTHDRGATPVLVTSMNRRTYDSEGNVKDSLAPYPETMRSVAASEHVALIDLNAMSKTLYEAIGEKDSRSLFVYAPANTYPGQPAALHDDTHFNDYGAYELARCVVLGIQQNKIPLSKFLREPAVRFDPGHPDATGAVALPATPFVDIQKPYER